MASAPLRDESLADAVLRARDGDESAVAELVVRMQDRLFRFLIMLGGNEELARDLSQDAFIAAIDRLDQLSDPAAFPGWLFQVARNRFIDHVRRPVNTVASRPPEEESGPAAEGTEIGLSVRDTLAELGEDERTVLLLVDMEGCSYQEVAEIMGVSESAVRSRLHRARKSFVECYEREKV